MRVLAVTNMYPTADRPYVGTFIEQQVRGLRDLGLDVRVLNIDRHREGRAIYRHAARLARAECESYRPDLVHVMYGGVMAHLVTEAIPDRPVVLTLHNSDILGDNLSGLLRKGISQVSVWCSRRAAARSSRVVLVSPHLRRALPAGIAPHAIAVIPCGIDLDLFRPMPRAACRERLAWDDEGFDILFPSNMGDPRKRPELARAAVALLKEDGIPARLRYLQCVPYDEVPVWFNACAAHVLTSQEEGSPTTVKEALACDVPVVSVDVGDVAERLRGIGGCYLARPEPRHLADCLRRVYQGPQRINGRDSVQGLSIRSIAERLRSLYLDVLGERRAHASRPRRREAVPACRA